MSYKLSKADVWAVDVMNRPGMLARVLESLRNAGGELEFMIARKAADTTSRVFLSPVKGKKQKLLLVDMTTAFKAVGAIDKDAMTVRVGTGAAVEEVLLALDKEGMTLGAYPSCGALTVGGCITAGTHGST